ncbi:hypothetical protein [Haloferax prahovense]|uniref:hypothetical protein n=1 Tax=Haloferax prahovense TaxID=381852 RepID=UPI00067944E0|nr:hypothetical protein [Haloferax prahovense]
MLRIASTYAAVGLGVGAAYLAGIHGDYLGAVALAVVAVAFVVLRLSLGDVVRVMPNIGSYLIVPSARSVAAVLFALALVSAAAGSGVMGPTAQQTVDDYRPVGDARAIACGGLCLAAGAGIAVSFGAGYLVSEYLSGDDTSQLYIDADANQTHVDVYQHGKTMRSGMETTDAVMTNQVEDGSRNIAWAKAKIAAIEALNRGESQAEVKNASKAAVEDYYTTMQMNYIGQYNDVVRKYHYLNETYEGHSELSSNVETGNVNESTGIWVFKAGFDYSYDGLNSTTYTAANGTEVNVSTVQFASGSETSLLATGGSRKSKLMIEGYDYAEYGSEPNLAVLNINHSANRLDAIETANSQMKSNADLYVENLMNAYSSGDIDISDIPDPSTLSQEYATEYNSTGYYAFAGADLALMGVGTSMNHSMAFEMADGTVYNGSLYTNWEPESTEGEWETGVTYYPSNATDSMVFFATNQGLIAADQPFTITQMTNVKTGETVENTTTQSYNRQTQNASLTLEELQSLLELQNELDAQKDDAIGGGGGLGFGGFSENSVLIGLAAIVVFLVGREN